MTFSARLNGLAAAVFGKSASPENASGIIATQLVEISRRLDSLEGTLHAGAPLSAMESAHMERFRLEQRMLADWRGDEREELVGRLRALLSKLRPMQAVGHRKARFGSKHDGGYILLDDFQSIDTVLSFGVEHNAEFDLQMAQRGMLVRQYDHTVESAPAQHSSIIWEKKKISPHLMEGTETLSNILKRCDKGGNSRNTILKLDIEHDEWPVFDTTSEQDLCKLAQITGEFHGFDYLADRQRLGIVERVFQKIGKNFAVIHVHANNYCDITNIFGLTIPYVLELTFVNRNLYELTESFETFPGELDAPCDPSRPDITLGMFRY